MKDYILVVSLLDDSKCEGCAQLDISKAVCKATKRNVGIRFDGNEWHTLRRTNCPLIPVDRVIWKMNYLNDQENITGSQATAWCERVLRDELGVTE